MKIGQTVSGLVLGAFALVASLASAADAPKDRYYFELKSITAKAELKPEAVKMATPRVLAEAKKAFEHHPQLVAKLDGAPDPKADPDGYRAFLAKGKLKDAYLVNVEITDATELLTPMPDKPGSQQLEIRIALRMLGSHIPDDTLGFTGHGKGKIQQEIGLKVNEHDRQDTWDQVTELAVSAAVKTAMEELELAAKTKPKQKPKPKAH